MGSDGMAWFEFEDGSSLTVLCELLAVTSLVMDAS